MQRKGAVHFFYVIIILKNRQEEDTRMKVVLAYDASEDAKEGIKVAKKFLKETKKGELILLHVVQKREDMSKEEEERALKIGEELLNNAKNEIIGNFSIRTIVLSEFSIPEAILNFVEKEDADLLILGARGVRAPILRYTLGSTAAKLAAFAPCSIYIVKKKEEIEE